MSIPLFLHRDVHAHSIPDIRSLQAVANQEYDNFYACAEPHVTIIGRPLSLALKPLDYESIVTPLPDSAEKRPVVDLAGAYFNSFAAVRKPGRAALCLTLGENEQSVRSEIALFQERLSAKIGRVISEHHPHITIGYVDSDTDIATGTDHLYDAMPSTLQLGILRIKPRHLVFPDEYIPRPGTYSAPRVSIHRPRPLPANFRAALQASSGTSR